MNNSKETFEFSADDNHDVVEETKIVNSYGSDFDDKDLDKDLNREFYRGHEDFHQHHHEE